MNDGLLHVSAPITTQQKSFVSVDIINYTQHMIDGLVLTMPNSLIFTEVQASSPLQIEKLPDSVGTNKQYRLKISEISPHSTTSIFLPFETNIIPIITANATDRKLSFESPYTVENPLWKLFKAPLLSALLISIVYFFFLLHNDNVEKKAELQKADLKTKAENLSNQLEKVMAEVKDIRKLELKQRIILLARLSDTSSELQFWRDTIRKLLYSNSFIGKEQAEQVISEITATLKTYAAQERIPDFDSTRLFAEIINKNDPEVSAKKENNK